jgi:hypothetical protein
MRVTLMTLGVVALASAVALSWWLLSGTTDVSSRPQVTRWHRLDHQLEIREGQLVGLANHEPFAWNDVHVEIGEGNESFPCPTLPSVGSGQSIRIQSSRCRSAEGLAPSRICVVRVAAQEGRIISAFEPCLPGQ